MAFVQVSAQNCLIILRNQSSILQSQLVQSKIQLHHHVYCKNFA